MEKIISNIFEEYNFESITLNNSEDSIKIFHNLNQNEYNIFIVDYRTNISDDYLSEVVPDLREEVDNTIKSIKADNIVEKFDSKINKNMYLIVCLKSETNSKINRKILEIEEDPYFFKKSVIHYEENELSIFNDAKDNEKFAEFIIETVTNEELFSLYKNDEDGSVLYNTCLKFTMAIPLLTLHMKTTDFPDLDKNLNNKLTNQNLYVINNLIQKIVIDSEDISIEDLEEYIEEKDILNLME